MVCVANGVGLNLNENSWEEDVVEADDKAVVVVAVTGAEATVAVDVVTAEDLVVGTVDSGSNVSSSWEWSQPGQPGQGGAFK